MAKYQVTKIDGQTGAVTKCGAAVKTAAKATNLRNNIRMSARITQPGHSNDYRINPV